MIPLTGSRLSLSFCLVPLLLSEAQFASRERAWFCRNVEAVEPCTDTPNSIDGFNNDLIYPILQKLLQRDFFKFYKVNMERPCPFWPDERECSSKECGVQHCDDEVPEALRNPQVVRTAVRSMHSAQRELNQTNLTTVSTCPPSGCPQKKLPKCAQVNENNGDDAAISTLPPCDTGNNFDPLDRSLTEVDRAQLADMEYNDRFCDVEDDDSADMHYVNLFKNPERYTGYKGNSALKVWQSIYQENCFKPDPRFDKNFLTQPTPTGMCLEKRVFYRLISGLHSAITVSIAAHSYKPPVGAFGSGTWFRNVEMFRNRFGTKWSWEGPERLMNIYFVYLLELRAIVKAASYLENELYYTGNDNEDTQTRHEMEQLLEACRSFENHYDETKLFTGVDSQARLLREEFRQHFVNISRIMDCVGCDKCRLWGKLQTHGMGTSLKVLFSDANFRQNSAAAGVVEERLPFKLTRNELVALIQSFGRYSSTIYEIGQFRREMMSELPKDRQEL